MSQTLAPVTTQWTRWKSEIFVNYVVPSGGQPCIIST